MVGACEDVRVAWVDVDVVVVVERKSMKKLLLSAGCLALNQRAGRHLIGPSAPQTQSPKAWARERARQPDLTTSFHSLTAACSRGTRSCSGHWLGHSTRLSHASGCRARAKPRVSLVPAGLCPVCAGEKAGAGDQPISNPIDSHCHLPPSTAPHSAALARRRA